jgi:hypothetical protein
MTRVSFATNGFMKLLILFNIVQTLVIWVPLLSLFFFLLYLETLNIIIYFLNIFL